MKRAGCSKLPGVLADCHLPSIRQIVGVKTTKGKNGSGGWGLMTAASRFSFQASAAIRPDPLHPLFPYLLFIIRPTGALAGVSGRGYNSLRQHPFSLDQEAPIP